MDLCDRRKELKGERERNPEAREQYRVVNNRIRRDMRLAKDQWIEEQCEEMDGQMRDGKTRLAFQAIKKITNRETAPVTSVEDKNGALLTKDEEVLGRWTEYCEELYNYNIEPDQGILSGLVRTAESCDAPIITSEVERAIKDLKRNKSPGTDEIPAELIQHGGQVVVDHYTTLCQKIYQDREWPKKWTQSLIIKLPKKGNTRKCENNRTISLICHASKILLKIIQNRIKSKAESILAEEQAGFRSGRSTAEQIFNLRVLTEKYLEHNTDLYHNFIDFRKAFDRVWQEGLWAVMRDFSFEDDMVELIEGLYKEACSAVIHKEAIGRFFKTTVGVRQGCPLSPVLFNIFLERIMQMSLENFQAGVSIGGREICNLRFADDIDLIADGEEELQELTTRLELTVKKFGMEINTDKSKILVNSRQPTQPCTININNTPLEQVNQFKYLGAVVTTDGDSSKELRTRLTLGVAAMASLARLWSGRSISIRTKVRVYRSMVVPVVTYGCEAWTLKAEEERRLQAFENKCYRRILKIPYTEHRTTEYVWKRIDDICGPHSRILSCVRERKLNWYGHLCRHTSLAKTVQQGTVPGGRSRGRPRKRWSDNIKEWTGRTVGETLRLVEDREGWREIVKTASMAIPLRPDNRSWD